MRDQPNPSIAGSEARETVPIRPNPELIDGPNVGLVLLSGDFRVIGMNAFAQELLQFDPSGFGKSVLSYHSDSGRDTVRCLLKQARERQCGVPVAMTIDVLNKVLMMSLCELQMNETVSERYLVAYFVDVTQETEAVRNPESGLLELKKLPVYYKGGFLFLARSSIYFFEADKNYCRVFSDSGKYYIQMSLKQIIERYESSGFVRTHKSYVVNVKGVTAMVAEGSGFKLEFNSVDIPHVPVARRRVKDIKTALGLL